DRFVRENVVHHPATTRGCLPLQVVARHEWELFGANPQSGRGRPARLISKPQLLRIAPRGVLARSASKFDEDQHVCFGRIRRWLRTIPRVLYRTIEIVAAVASELGRSKTVQVIEQYVIRGISVLLRVGVLQLCVAKAGTGVVRFAI